MARTVFTGQLAVTKGSGRCAPPSQSQGRRPAVNTSKLSFFSGLGRLTFSSARLWEYQIKSLLRNKCESFFATCFVSLPLDYFIVSHLAHYLSTGKSWDFFLLFCTHVSRVDLAGKVVQSELEPSFGTRVDMMHSSLGSLLKRAFLSFNLSWLISRFSSLRWCNLFFSR